MSDIRGEKIVFRKEDIVVLHSLPSAQAHDPCIVHAPERRGMVRRLASGCVILSTLAAVLLAAVLVTMETGAFDTMLNERATTALNAAIGEGYHADVGSTAMRLTSSGAIGLRASNVTLLESVSDKRLVSTNSVTIELDPLALMTGRISVSRLEAEGATLDPSLLPKGGPIDLTTIRIAGVGSGLETVFKQMDSLSQLIARSNTEVVSIADLKLSVAGPRGRVVPVIVKSVDFTRTPDGSMQIDGAFDIDSRQAELHLKAERRGDLIERLSGTAGGLPLSAFLHRNQTATELAFGVDSSAELNIEAVRAAADTPPVFRIAINSTEGAFEAGGFSSTLKPSKIDIAYNFDSSSIDILPSVANIGQSTFPFTGAVKDLDASAPKKGFAINLLLQGASSKPEDVSEPALVFDAKAQGSFLSESHELVFNELTVSSGLGSLAGSLSMQFGATSPQISFAALTTQLQSAAVKQLWPWWVGRNARNWVINNIYGGTVSNGKIELFLPMGRLTNTVGPTELKGDELSVRFDIAGARVNIAGDIPPLRDAAGAFQLKGEHLEVEMKGGTAYFPSGRSVSITGGDFIIPKTYDKPLMAEMKLSVSGQADAIAELVSYRPLLALQRTPFTVDDFSGPMTADVGARFGLVKAQNPPAPQWQTEMQLDGVSLKKPIAGRQISDIRGALRIDPQQAVLDAKADIDDVTMDVSLVEPVGADSPVKRQRTISGTVPDGTLAKLSPGLSGILSGPIPIKLSIDAGDRQDVSVDLSDATLSLPWIGWSKGRGIGATAKFSVEAKDGVTKISDLVLSGDQFGAKGNLQLDQSGLSTAKFSSVQLAANDNYAIDVKRQKNGYGIVVDGASADMRPIIESLRRPAGTASGNGNPTRMAIEASLQQVRGFNGENLSNVNLSYAARGKDIDSLSLSAVTDSGQAVVANMVGSGADNTLELTSGDAGAFARFADIYSNMRGGLLNLKLRDRGAGSWRGSVDIRKFSLIDEARLQSMVSTPADPSGRSLNQAVKKDINVSSARFERGFANVALDSGTVQIANGLVRGTDVGATFQGTVRDQNGNMDMTGTFMPAYGLNRLFGELPLIGTLLGNGRDRGLLGITFKVSGPFSKPSLQINPLSIIAPGVFRNIFEFQ